MTENEIIEVLESDKFSCIIVNIINSSRYKNITIEEPFSKSYVYFGKVSLNADLEIGDQVYISIKRIGNIEDKTNQSMKVFLYDSKNNVLDWTIIY